MISTGTGSVAAPALKGAAQGAAYWISAMISFFCHVSCSGVGSGSVAAGCGDATAVADSSRRRSIGNRSRPQKDPRVSLPAVLCHCPVVCDLRKLPGASLGVGEDGRGEEEELQSLELIHELMSSAR